MSSQDLNTIFDIKNLKAMSRNTDFVFKGVYELRVRKVKGDTTTFFVTLQFIPKKVQPYADFQAERMAHPKFSGLFPQGEDSAEIIGEYFNYLSKYFKSRDFISSFQTEMIKYVNKLFGQRGGFGIYPIQDYDIIDTEPFTVVELAFKGHFTRQSKKVGDTVSLRNKVIRLAHQKPELREHLLPLLKEANIHDKALALRIQRSRAGKMYGLSFEAGFKSNRKDSDGAITYQYATNIISEYMGSVYKEKIYIDVTTFESSDDQMFSVQAEYGKGTWDYYSEKDLMRNLPKVLANLKKQLG